MTHRKLGPKLPGYSCYAKVNLKHEYDNLTIKKKPFLTSRCERNYVVYIWLVDFMHSAKQMLHTKVFKNCYTMLKDRGSDLYLLVALTKYICLNIASNQIVIYILRKHPYVYVMYLAPNLCVFLQAEGGNG